MGRMWRAGPRAEGIARAQEALQSLTLLTSPQTRIVSQTERGGPEDGKGNQGWHPHQLPGGPPGDYFASLAKIEEAGAVAVVDPEGRLEAAARKALVGKLAGVYKDPADLLKRFEPQDRPGEPGSAWPRP